MGLLRQIYSLFGLGYSIALAKLKHKHLSHTDKAFLWATAASVFLSLLSFLNQLRSIPSEYRVRFIGKSFLRGLLRPLLTLLQYPFLFYSQGCMGKVLRNAFTFSNEANHGIELTRQLKIFELDVLGSRDRRYLTTHDLFWYAEHSEWGYKRLVGEIWVSVRFPAHFRDVDPDRGFRLQTSDIGGKLLLLYRNHDPKQNLITEENIPGLTSANVAGQEIENASGQASGDVESGVASGQASGNVESGVASGQASGSVAGQAGGNVAEETSAKVSWICTREDIGSGLNSPTPETPETTRGPYRVTITRERQMFKFEGIYCCSCPSYTWSLSSTVVRNWTLFQIHQYMLCLDVWGNHPKQGIWKPRELKTCCSSDTSCCSACSNKYQIRYCYRHDELIKAIQDNKRLTETWNDGTWHAVV